MATGLEIDNSRNLAKIAQAISGLWNEDDAFNLKCIATELGKMNKHLENIADQLEQLNLK